MTENTATRANDSAANKPAASLLSVVSKLKSGAVRALARHQQREAALRVHRATRQDRGIDSTDAAHGAEVPRAPAEGSDDRARPRPFALMANRLRRLFDAHAARLYALRVYDRRRG